MYLHTFLEIHEHVRSYRARSCAALYRDSIRIAKLAF